MNRGIMAVLAAAISLSFAACQDHHFVPMDKADKIHIPTGTEEAPATGFVQDAPAQKQVIAEAEKMQAPKPGDAAGLIVDGQLELGAEQKKAAFTGWTVYVLVRQADQPGPPVAVSRLAAGQFPMGYAITNSNLMMGAPPAPGAKLLVEARLDKDGDPMTKAPGDVYGFTVTAVKPGDRGVMVVLDQVRR